MVYYQLFHNGKPTGLVGDWRLIQDFAARMIAGFIFDNPALANNPSVNFVGAVFENGRWRPCKKGSYCLGIKYGIGENFFTIRVRPVEEYIR